MDTMSKAQELGRGPVLAALEDPSQATSVMQAARLLARALRRSILVGHAAPFPMASAGALSRLGLPEEGPVVIHALVGEPGEQVLALAAETDPALLVCGLPEAGRPLGPIREEFLCLAPCPVLLVPARLPEAWRERRRVLLPLDGTPRTAAARPLAQELAERLGGALDILHVATALPAEPGAMSVPRFMDQPHLEWAAWREEFLDRFDGRDGPGETHLFVETGPPGEAIFRVAAEREPILIVVGWHGRLAGGHAAILRSLLERTRWPLLATRLLDGA